MIERKGYIIIAVPKTHTKPEDNYKFICPHLTILHDDSQLDYQNCHIFGVGCLQNPKNENGMGVLTYKSHMLMSHSTGSFFHEKSLDMGLFFREKPLDIHGSFFTRYPKFWVFTIQIFQNF